MSNNPWRPGSEPWMPDSASINDAIKRYLNKNPGRPSQPNIVINRINGFGYEKHDRTSDTNRMDRFSKLCTHTILSSYMTRFNLLQLYNDKLYDVLDRGASFHAKEFINRCKRLLKDNDSPRNFRIEMPQHIEMVFINPDKENGFHIWHLQYDKRKTIVKVWIYFTDPVKFTIGNPIKGPMVLGKRSKDVDMALRSSKNRSSTTNYDSLILINEILYQFRSNPYAMEETVIAEHQDVEMFFIRKLVKEINTYEAMSVNVYGWQNPELFNSHKEQAFSLQRFSDHIIHPDEECPLVDLSLQEIKFMTNYVRDKNYVGKDADGVDAIKYLSHPRYGPNLRIQMEDSNGNIDEIITSIDLYPEDDFMRFYGVKVISPEMTAYTIIDFTGLQHFNIYDNLCDVSAEVIQTNPDNMVSSGSAMEDLLPECFRNIEGAFTLFFETIVVHIMLFDRPKRTRVIRYTERVERPTSQKKDDEPEFIVRRILKPIQEAKRLVAESAAATGQMKERFYTMEEWERIGHWRRLPHSERSIWIPETTCHRHLPLSDKEIHIKL